MIISHNLNNNGYFINNEIWFEITADLPVTYFRLVLMNLSNAKTSTQFISYTDPNNKVFVNIQSIVKSLFDVPNGEVNNSSKFAITIYSNSGQVISFFTWFVRGGKRTNEINQTSPNTSSLRLSEKLPVWGGYPVFDFEISNYTIYKQNISDVTNIDYRRIKGCNNIYLKFLNQKGGYSYWLFESYSEKETNSNLGYLVNSKTNNLLDLGNESKSDLQIYSKIPKEYRDYAKDIIVSPDIYAYQNGGWKKIFMKSNSVEFDNIKKVYVTNLNIDLNYRFNPSLLW